MGGLGGGAVQLLLLLGAPQVPPPVPCLQTRQ